MIEMDKITEGNGRSNLFITEEMKSNIQGTTKWISFLNVLGAIGLALLVIVGIGCFVVASAKAAVLGVIYLLMAFIFFFPLRRSFSMVSQARAALQHNSNEDLGKMFGNMMYIAKFWGINTIVVLCLYVLALVGAVIASLAT